MKPSRLLSLCLPVALFAAFPVIAGASDAAPQPELRKLERPQLFATGTITVEIGGSTVELLTTTETVSVSEEQINAAKPEVQKILRATNGKVVDTAVIRVMGDEVFVSLAAEGPYGKNGTLAKRKEKASLKLDFALSKDTFTLRDGQRSLSYVAPGQKRSDAGETRDFDLNVDSYTPLADGYVELKGSFSGRLTQTSYRKELAEPIDIRGQFNIIRAGSSSVLESMIKGAVKQ